MKRVKFAYPFTDAAGRKFKQGQEADVDPGVAASLIAEGRAVYVATEKAAKAAKKEG